MPSLADLETTKSSISSYSLFIYNKESEVLKKNLKSIEFSLEMANEKIKILFELYPELMHNVESLEEIFDGINHSDGALNISVNNGFEKIKNN